MKNFDIKCCLEELAGTFKQEAKIKGMDLQLDYERSIGLEYTDDVRTDESKLRLVLYNLLSNSVRYSQNGLIRIKSRFLSH
jgi:signal transduction histidine kinase